MPMTRRMGSRNLRSLTTTELLLSASFHFRRLPPGVGDGLLRPGTRLTGAANAMLLARLPSSLRHHSPWTHISGPLGQPFRHAGGDRGDGLPAPDQIRLQL